MRGASMITSQQCDVESWAASTFGGDQLGAAWRSKRVMRCGPP
jgi:hypothetical protein